MFTKNMVVGIIILIVILIAALIAFSFIRYRVIAKRNQAADKANEMLFLARMQAQQQEKEERMNGSIEILPERKLSEFSQQVIKESPAPKTEEHIVPKIPTEEELHPRKLNEFFGSNQ